MSERHQQLIAYLSTLAALCFVLLSALIVSANYPAIIGKIEAYGLGTITGGLIGVLRLPRSDPPSVGPNENVNVTTDTPPATEPKA